MPSESEGSSENSNMISFILFYFLKTLFRFLLFQFTYLGVHKTVPETAFSMSLGPNNYCLLHPHNDAS